MMKKYSSLHTIVTLKKDPTRLEIEVVQIGRICPSLFRAELIILNKMFSRFARANYQLNMKRNDFLCA